MALARWIQTDTLWYRNVASLVSRAAMLRRLPIKFVQEGHTLAIDRAKGFNRHWYKIIGCFDLSIFDMLEKSSTFSSGCNSDQSRTKVFWGPRLDTIVGSHTHPSHLPLNPSTWLEFGVSPPKKFGIAKAIGEFQRRNQVKISEGKNEDKAGTYGAKCQRIEGKAPTEIERGRDLRREFNEPLPRKFVKI